MALVRRHRAALLGERSSAVGADYTFAPTAHTTRTCWFVQVGRLGSSDTWGTTCSGSDEIMQISFTDDMQMRLGVPLGEMASWLHNSLKVKFEKSDLVILRMRGE